MSDLSGTVRKVPVPPGMQRLNALREGGFSIDEIMSYKRDASNALLEGGFTPVDVDAHWGDTPPDPKPIENLMKQNFEGVKLDDKQKIASDPIEYLQAGWGTSVIGLALKNPKHAPVLGADAGVGAKVAQGAGQLAGDLPFAVGGAMGGIVAGAPLGPVGMLVGAGAGGALLPEALRQTLLVYYNSGQITDWKSFVSVTGEAALKVGKATLAGVVSAPVGFVGGKIVGNITGRVLPGQITDATVQATTYATVAGALDGHVPDASDFTAGGILAVGTQLAFSLATKGKGRVTQTPEVLPPEPGQSPTQITVHPSRTGDDVFGNVTLADVVNSEPIKRVEKNMQEAYVKHGLTPWELASAAQQDPIIRQELITQDITGQPVFDHIAQAAKQEPLPPEVIAMQQEIAQQTIMDKVGWHQFSKHMSARITPYGEIKADPHAVASYLQKFGELAGFRFLVGPEMSERVAREGGTRTGEAGPHALSWDVIVNGRKRTYAQVYMPSNPEAQFRAWYGLGRSEVMYHEVGHAIENMIFKSGGAWEQTKLTPGLREELEVVSRRFRPYLWEKFPDHNMKPAELMADAIAVWLSNPGERKNMPLFAEGYGKRLEPYVEIVEKTLPKRNFEGEWTGPNGEKIDNGDPGPKKEQSGGGGGKQPPPGKPPAVDDPIQPPPKGNKKIEGPGPMDEDILNAKWNEKQGVATLKDDTWKLDQMYRQYVSELGDAATIDKILEKQGYDLDKKLGFEDALRSTYASGMRAGYFSRFGVLDAITLNKVSDASRMMALDAARKGGGNAGDFINYLLAKRTLDKSTQGIDTGFDVNEAKQLVEYGKKKYAAAEKTWNEVNRGVLQYAKDSGLFSAEQVARMEEANPTHISMRRLLGEKETLRSTPGRGFRSTNPLKRMGSSDLAVLDPLLMSVDNDHQLVKMADRNRAIGQIVTLAEQGGINPLLGLKMLEKDVKATVAKPGSDKFDPYLPEDIRNFTPFLAERAQRFGKASENEFMYYRDGKAERWHTDNVELARLLRGADSAGEALAHLRVAQNLASWQRSGIVGSPDFPIRTGFFGQLSAYIAAPHSPPPFVHFFGALFDAFTSGPRYQEHVAKGGAAAALVEMDINRIAQDMKALEVTGTFEKMYNVVRHPLEAAQLLQERLDAAARMGDAAYLKTKGTDDIKAHLTSRKTHLDFMEKGTAAFMHTWARTTPFMRPGILGLDQMVKAFKERPAETGLKAAAAISIPQMVLWTLNYLQDEYGETTGPKYKDLPRWQKDTMFILPEIGGFRLRLPMPPGLGVVFGGVPTRLLDWSVQNDKAALNEIVSTILASFLPPLLPTILVPAVEYTFGRDTFTKRPLIPASMERASPDMQYTEETTEIAKTLSRILGNRNPPTDFLGDDMGSAPVRGFGIGVSPIMLEENVKAWFGTAGMNALRALNAPFNANGRPWEVADIPIVQAFVVRNPRMGAQPIKDFFDANKSLQETIANQRLARERLMVGAPGAEQEFNTAYSEPPLELKTITDALRMGHSLVLGVHNDKDLKDYEKRQKIDPIYASMVQQAREGLALIYEFKKQQAQP